MTRRVTIYFVLLFAALGAPRAADYDAETSLHLRANGNVRALQRVGDSLWIGTGAGVFVYDLGNDRFVDTFTVSGPLLTNSVRAISTWKDSVLVGTDDGLVIFTPDTVTVLSRHGAGFGAVPLEEIRSIDFGLGGELFLGTYGLGVGVIAGDTSYAIVRADSLLDNKVYGAVQQDDTTFFYATSMGLCAWRDSVWVGFQAGAGIPRGEILQMIPISGERYYLLVGGRGIYRFDGNFARRVSRSGIFPEDDVSAIAVDTFGNLWAAGRFGGIAVYQNDHWTKMAETDKTIWQQPWRTAVADDQGGVFFGAASGIVVGIESSQIRRIEIQSELDGGDIHRLVIDGTGAVYFLSGARVMRLGERGRVVEQPLPGTAADLSISPSGGLWAAGRWGIFRLDKDGFAEFPVDADEPNPAFVSLCFDDNGYLWVATRTSQIYRFDGMLWMRMTDSADPVLAAVNRILPDGTGGVWAFRFGGPAAVAAHWRSGRWSLFGPGIFGTAALVDALLAPNGTVVALSPTHVWGFNRSASKWQPVAVHNAPETADSADVILSPLGGERFRCAAFAPAGQLVVGTGGHIGVLGDTGFRWIGTTEGLAGLHPTAILAVSEETIWIGFRDDGLQRLPRKSLW